MLLRSLKVEKVVEATSWFTKTGPSPNPPPTTNFAYSSKKVVDADTADKSSKALTPGPSSSVADAGAITEDVEIEGPPTRVDMSGVWNRIRVHNVDSYVGMGHCCYVRQVVMNYFVGAQGAGFLQRKLAASVPMVHTITMNPPDLNAFRIQVRRDVE